MNPPADPPPTHTGRKDLVTVHFPPGTYKVTKTLFINRGMRVTGARKNFSLISFQDMPADADGLRAWKYELNGTGIVMERLQLRAGDLGAGAMLSIRGAHESLIEDVTFYGKDGTSPSTALRIINSQDLTLSRLVFHRVGKLGAPVTTGAALSIFKEAGAGSVAPNNIYLNDCRWENTIATPIALKNCRGIYFQGGKIDQSFGSEVEDNAPGLHLENATGTEVHRFFIGGIKGPVAHVIGYSNLLMADTRMGPGLYDAFFTGDPAYGDPSESGFLPGRILTPQITLRNCTVDLSALNVTSGVASVFKIPLKDYRQYTGLAITAISYDLGTDTTRVDVMTGPGWSSSDDSVKGKYLVNQSTGVRWLISGNTKLETNGNISTILLSGNISSKLNIGDIFSIDWDILPAFRAWILDSTVVDRNNITQKPKIYYEYMSNVRLNSATYDTANHRTALAIASPVPSWTYNQIAGYWLVDANNEKSYVIRGNTSGMTFYVDHDRASELTAAIADGHKFHIRSGIDTTQRIIGGTTMWVADGQLRVGDYPIIDWHNGGAPL